VTIFRTSRGLERRIDEFLDTVAEGVLVFREAVSAYLDGDASGFHERLTALERLEGRADALRREVEAALYSHSLIPEHRGDVLGLLEHTDDIIDRAKTSIQRIDVEQPEIPDRWHDEYRHLADVVVAAAEAVTVAARRFFREPAAIDEVIYKVHHYESEADQIGLRLRRDLFADAELDLARRQHLRYFVESIDRVADIAEGVADRLAISAIKRRL
jgi:predicted phosphate transport protein (TIGR00153 family)